MGCFGCSNGVDLLDCLESIDIVDGDVEVSDVGECPTDQLPNCLLFLSRDVCGVVGLIFHISGVKSIGFLLECVDVAGPW